MKTILTSLINRLRLKYLSSQKNAQVSRVWQWYKYVAAIFLVLILNVGCTQQRSPNIDLTLQVQPTNRPGVYLVSGNTNLPDESQITVAAIRFFDTANVSNDISGQNQNYSILNRQVVKVEQGNWQSNLNLWQVAPDGNYQENWQLNQSQLGLTLNPSSDVTFVALFEQSQQSPGLADKLEKDKRLQGNLVRFTDDGQWYIKASKKLSVALPTGKTTPPIVQAQDITDKASTSVILKPERVNSPATNASQTNAPLSPAEMLR